MALTVNPDAGLSAPDTFREEGLYAFRFDSDGDACENVAFKVTFSAVSHASGGEHRHVQGFEVRRSTGEAARKGVEGEIISTGVTEQVSTSDMGVMAYAGLAPDLFAGDAAALNAFKAALSKENRFDGAAFTRRESFFAQRNVSLIILEVPNHLIDSGHVHGWATASLYGHAPELQVSRWGLPLITHIFMPDLGMREAFNRAGPAEDIPRFSAEFSGMAEMITTLAGSAADPADYAWKLVARLCPVMLPNEIDSPGAFDVMSFNGRALADDGLDVILTLASNTPSDEGVAPDPGRTRTDFPYFGAPYSPAEQAGLAPATKSGKRS